MYVCMYVYKHIYILYIYIYTIQYYYIIVIIIMNSTVSIIKENEIYTHYTVLPNEFSMTQPDISLGTLEVWEADASSQ